MLKSKIVILISFLILNSNLFAQTSHMPAESLTHEGTWLQWPHQYEYGVAYRNRMDATWVAMTSALVSSEKVHIIAYNSTEQTRIINLLTAAGVSLTNIDFRNFHTNDVWVRDNGPIFAMDANGNFNIQDWGFNGWGGDYNSNLDNQIPTSVASAIGMSAVNLNSVMTLEGGAYEMDGNGVFMACKSSIISQSPANSVRNPGMTQAQAEGILAQYLSATKFIWLNGFTGTDDITDAHIDGFAKFANDSTLVTMNNADLLYWGLSAADMSTLYAASNVSNVAYDKVYVPLTQNNVVTTYGVNLGYKGSYINYYIGNTVVLVPNYNDPNDAVANAIIQTLHPGRTVIGIDVRNLYANGGMVHCVTQQQPAYPTCNAPTNVSASSITSNKATISWIGNSGAYDYKLQYRIQGAGSWTTITITAPTVTKNLTSLLPLTTYEYQLRTDCNSGGTNYSSYTATQTFTTLCSCAKPANIIVSPITQSSATFNWTGNSCAYKYRLQVRKQGTAAWTTSLITAPTTTKIQNGLTANTTYEYRMRTDCNGTGSSNSGWITITTFTSPLRLEEMNLPPEIFAFTVSPNPANGNFKIEMNASQGSSASVRVTNVMGQEILYQTVFIASGENAFNFTLDNVASGIYFIDLKNENGSARKMLEVVK